MRFVLWEGVTAPDEAATERYEVLHLSARGLARPPGGASLVRPGWVTAA